MTRHDWRRYPPDVCFCSRFQTIDPFPNILAPSFITSRPEIEIQILFNQKSSLSSLLPLLQLSKLLSSLREIDVLRYVVSNKLLTRYSIRNGGCDVMVKNIKARARIVERFLILKISRLGLMAREGGRGRRKRRPKTLGRLSTRMQERCKKEDRAREEGTTRKRIGRAA